MKIITISREFGSGGRELGKRLAEELGRQRIPASAVFTQGPVAVDG